MGDSVEQTPPAAGDGNGWSAADPEDALARVGEEEALRRILRRLPAASGVLLGPGDDAAVLGAADGRHVVTTDMMVEGPDFRTAWSTPFEFGWKAAATNLSDVAAMGAVPTAILVALAVPSDTAVTALEGICDGLVAACARLAPGCGVAGGDLSTSATATVAITAFGDLEGRAPVTRSGARPGDVLAYSGDLGAAGAGLALLFAEAVDAAGRPDAERARRLRRAHPHELAAQLAPVPPIEDGPAAAQAGAHAMLDVSDGLLLDAARLARASGVVIDVDTALVGEVPAGALTAGEDHGLLAAFAADAALPGGFRVIGRIGPAAGAEPGVLVDGAPHAGAPGWDPYRGRSAEPGSAGGAAHQSTVSP